MADGGTGTKTTAKGDQIVRTCQLVGWGFVNLTSPVSMTWSKWSITPMKHLQNLKCWGRRVIRWSWETSIEIDTTATIIPCISIHDKGWHHSHRFVRKWQTWQTLQTIWRCSNLAPKKRKGILFRSQKGSQNQQVCHWILQDPPTLKTNQQNQKICLNKNFHEDFRHFYPCKPTHLILFQPTTTEPPCWGAQTWIPQAPILVEDAMTPPGSVWKNMAGYFATVFFGAWWNCAWRCRFHNYFEIGFSKTFIQKRKVFHVYVHGESFFFRILIPKKNCVQLFDTDPNWTSFPSSVFGHQKKICQKIWKLLWTMMLVEMAINFPSCTNNSNLHPLALENKSWSVPSAKSGWVDGNPSRAITGMLEKGQATIFTETWSCVILDHLGVSTTKTWQNFGGFDVSKRFKTKVSILFCLSPITVNIQKLPDMDTVVSSNPDHWVWIYTYMFFPSWYSFL